MYIETESSLVETMMMLLELTEDIDRIKCQFYLDSAADIINIIRDTGKVEPKYHNIQIKMAIELYNKQGAEGQTSHSENGISRVYSSSDISDALLSQITPVGRTPLSNRGYPVPL